MVQALWHGQSHGGAQDASGLARQTLGRLTHKFHAGVGEQGVLAARRFEGMLDEQHEAFALNHGFELNTDLDASSW